MKINNKQKFTNSQRNVNMTAWWDIITWNVNKQEVIDNSWYNIPKEDKTFLENIWKYIEWKLWEEWRELFSNILKIIWWVWILTPSFLVYSFSNNNILVIAISYGWIIILVWLLIFWTWSLISRSLQHKYDSQCPKCKKPYSLLEVWEPKEKEIKTSKWYKVTQVRNYKCKNCKFKKEEITNFTRPLK